MSLTPRQAAVEQAVVSLTARRGYPPTYREVASEVGVSLATTRQKVAALEKAGVLQHDVGVCRSLRTKERSCLTVQER